MNLLVLVVFIFVVIGINATVLTDLDVIHSGISITPQSPSIVNLIGTDNNQATGPHITTYTSADNYPLKQSVSYQHNNIIDCYDCYFDGNNWRVSYSGSYFRVSKRENKYIIEYGSGGSPGGYAYFNNALSITTSGVTTMNNIVINTINATTANIGEANILNLNVLSGIKFLANGDTDSTLDRYSSDKITLNVYGSYSGGLVSTIMDFVRVGDDITLTIRAFNVTVTTITYFYIDTTNIDPQYLPGVMSTSLYRTQWPVYVNDNGLKLGMVQFEGTSTSTIYKIYSANAGLFTVGAGRGWGDISVNYKFN